MPALAAVAVWTGSAAMPVGLVGVTATWSTGVYWAETLPIRPLRKVLEKADWAAERAPPCRYWPTTEPMVVGLTPAAWAAAAKAPWPMPEPARGKPAVGWEVVLRA